MSQAGLDISDDAIRCIEYHRTPHGLVISKHFNQDLPDGLVVGGDIKDEKKFVSILSELASKNKISYVKVSLPEEKAYLFQTDVPSADFKSIAQNIDFKLEQNVPLSAADALFQFDLMPEAVTGEALRASVSVVPKKYVEHYISLLKSAYLFPVAFEIVPKAIVAAYVPEHLPGTHLIVHVMNKKTGLYIVSEGVVCFTSTISWGSVDEEKILMKEVERVHTYWVTREDVHTDIAEIVVVGLSMDRCEKIIGVLGNGQGLHSMLPNVWNNAFDINAYVPPIIRSESLEYAVAAGLAL